MKHNKPSVGIDRRDFLKLGAVGVGAAMAGGCAPEAESSTTQEQEVASQQRNLGPAPEQLFAAPPMDLVRVGYVGVGGMGTAHVRNLLRIEGAQITAICDIRESYAQRAHDMVVEAGFPAPTLYTRGERDFERMCAEEDLDLVYNATPWRWHVPICVAAMQNGKHAATEVPAALTVDECWELVEAAEQYQKHCVMMENCNYGRAEMMVLNMSRQGLFGEILHAECGYMHDLRAVKHDMEGEGMWRRAHSMNRDANLYPTHGLGPVAQCMDINRGDQFSYLVSMSSPSRGLQLYAQDNFPEGAPQRAETFKLGDVNTALIKTVNGRTIILGHDTNLPRPYSRINMVQGTKGIFQGYPDRVHIAGRSEGHSWEPAEDYYAEFEHPLWRAEAENARGAGHGGMDYIEDYRLIKCLLDGHPTDMNVYDAAALSCVTHLTEMSVANGSQPVEFPDFTRGRWKTWPQLEIVGA